MCVCVGYHIPVPLGKCCQQALLQVESCVVVLSYSANTLQEFPWENKNPSWAGKHVTSSTNNITLINNGIIFHNKVPEQWISKQDNVFFPPMRCSMFVAPYRPNVCAEREVKLVAQRQPCVQAFSRMVKVWKQGCVGQSWCMGYERR